MAKKKVFFHAPEFFPPLDFFFGLVNSNVWVVLDHMTFSSRSRQSRCRIKTDTGVQLLAIGVKRPQNKPVCQTMIDNMQPWRRLFFKGIKRHYADAPFFNEYYAPLKNFVESPHVLLETFTLQTCLWVAALLGKQIEFMRTSDVYTQYPVSKVIPVMLNRVGGVPFNVPFSHPYYQQLSEPFERDLSILDPLFCIGAEKTAQLLENLLLRSNEIT